MDLSFITKRIKEQSVYLEELDGRFMKGEVTETRYSELYESALAVKIRFEKMVEKHKKQARS